MVFYFSKNVIYYSRMNKHNTPTFEYSTDDSGEIEFGEILKSPDDVMSDLERQCATPKELDELKRHVQLFKLGEASKAQYYVILTDVQPESEEQYLSLFNARRIPLDVETFRLRAHAAKSLEKIPENFNPDTSLIFEVAGYDL